MTLPPRLTPLPRHAATTLTLDADFRRWRLVEHVGPDRADAEAFIARRYASSFGARLHAFMPRLFALRGVDGAIGGAFGLRGAHQRLFAEHYLDDPIERAIQRRTAERIERAAVVEVGQLCGAFSGAVRVLIGLLAQRLHGDGFEWVAFTGTAELRNAFARVGLQPIDLGAACAERLPPEERGHWGDYYEHRPRVCAGRIETGLRAFGDPSARQRRRAGRPA